MKKNGLVTGVMYVVLVLLVVGLGFLLFFNYRANMEQKEEIRAAEEAASATATPAPTEEPAPTAEPQRTVETLDLAFAGDLVGHAGLTTDALSEEEGAYDFSHELAGVQASIADADLAACTLVSTLSDEGTYDAYVMPRAVATALRDAGFDLVNAATDHILDRGVTGLTATVDYLKNAGLTVTGAYSASTSRSLPVAQVNGVKVAFLSYSYGTAGTGAQPVSVADSSWCIDLLTTDYMTDKQEVDYGKIDADLAAVKEAGADVVVSFLYWWDSAQYHTEPRPQQTEVVDYLCQNGVDVIIGGGVKVPQPIEVRTVEREGGKANCVICYSLSSLMSCFNDNYTNLSAVVDVQISRDTDSGEIWISGVSTKPLFMVDTADYTDSAELDYKYRVLDAWQAVEDYENGAADAVTAEICEAIRTGIGDLDAILGPDYAAREGGLAVDFPY